MREPIEEAVKILCGMYNRKINDNLLMAWDIGLKKYSDDQIRKAIIGYCERSDSLMFPTPSLFIQYKFQAPLT